MFPSQSTSGFNFEGNIGIPASAGRWPDLNMPPVDTPHTGDNLEEKTHETTSETNVEISDLSRERDRLANKIRALKSKNTLEPGEIRPTHRSTDRVQTNTYRPAYGSRVVRIDSSKRVAKAHTPGSFSSGVFHISGGIRKNNGIRKTTDNGFQPRDMPQFDSDRVMAAISGAAPEEWPQIAAYSIEAAKSRIVEWARITGLYRENHKFNIPTILKQIAANPHKILGMYNHTATSINGEAQSYDYTKWIPLDIVSAISTRDRTDALEWMPLQMTSTMMFGIRTVYVNIVDPQKDDYVIIRTKTSNCLHGPAMDTLSVFSGNMLITQLPTCDYIDEVNKYRGAQALVQLGS